MYKLEMRYTIEEIDLEAQSVIRARIKKRKQCADNIRMLRSIGVTGEDARRAAQAHLAPAKPTFKNLMAEFERNAKWARESADSDEADLRQSQCEYHMIRLARMIVWAGII